MQLTHGRPPVRLVTESSRGSSALSAVAIAAALLGILVLDASTAAAPVQHLYYLPIAFAGVTFRWRGGLLCALVSIGFYHLANPHALTWHAEQPDILQMSVFIAAGVLSARLADDARRLRRMALTDDLTGLHNLRSFEERLRGLVATARETGQPLSMLVLDVDRLKSLNDVHGHLAGAEAVRLVGRVLAEQLPSNAVACRYGGDEFVVALPGSDAHGASVIAERVGRHVHGLAPTLAGVPLASGTLSISIGIASRSVGKGTVNGSGFTETMGEQLFRDADAALYAAKNGGRNRISVADASTAPHSGREARRSIDGYRHRVRTTR